MKITALVKVFMFNDEQAREEFLIHYSLKKYLSPDELAFAIERYLKFYLEEKGIALTASIGIEANQTIGHFFESTKKKLGIERFRTFVITLH